MFAIPFYAMSNNSGSQAQGWQQLHIGAKILSITLYIISLLGISLGIYLLASHYPTSFLILILTGSYVIITTSIFIFVPLTRNKVFLMITAVIIVGFSVASFCLLVTINHESYCGLMWSCNNSQVQWSSVMSQVQLDLNQQKSFILTSYCNAYNDPSNSTSYHNKTNIASQLANYVYFMTLPIQLQENQLAAVDTASVRGIDLTVSSLILAYGIYLFLCGLIAVLNKGSGDYTKF